MTKISKNAFDKTFQNINLLLQKGICSEYQHRKYLLYGFTYYLSIVLLTIN